MRDEDDQIVGSDWLGSTDAAARLGVTSRTLYRMVDDGELPAYRMGRVIRFKRADLDEFIASRRIEPGTITDLFPDSRDRDVS